jgi:hypothetical protein
VTVPSSWLITSTPLIIKKEVIDEGMEKLNEKIKYLDGKILRLTFYFLYKLLYFLRIAN